MDEVRRKEKHFLKNNEYVHCKNIVSKVLDVDEFAANGSYNIRYLYFDSIGNRDLGDKFNLHDTGTTVQLGICSPDDKWAKLELKQKVNTYQKEQSLCISKLDALQLIDGNYYVLLHYGNAFAKEMFYLMTAECYKPKYIIEYKRDTYESRENNIQLTFDIMIHRTEHGYDLYSEELSAHAI